jgi:hypothetical protein
MGSIQFQRGSVRQVPPQVYSGFVSSDDDHDAGKECVEIAVNLTFFLFCGLVVFAIVTIVRGIFFWRAQ